MISRSTDELVLKQGRASAMITDAAFAIAGGLAWHFLHQSKPTPVGPVVLMGGQGAETAIAAQAATFPDVHFQEIMPPNMGAGVNIISGGSGQYSVLTASIAGPR